MLTVYRGNRAELLAELLATQLRLDPPDPFEQVQVVVNTWPTSRWLGEQLAVHLGGIAANLRFPFPAACLSRIVDALLAEGPPPQAVPPADPWRAERLVWPLLEALPAIAAGPDGAPLRRWLGERDPGRRLDLATWQLGRSIADAFDDYALYRPELLRAWRAGDAVDGRGRPLPESQRWQPLLHGVLMRRLGTEPFALRVERAIERLRGGGPLPDGLRGPLRLFGLSSLAPVQVRLLQALGSRLAVDLYLLTPCRDLWQRCVDRRRSLGDALALQLPLEDDWLLEAPPLEARFGRLGGEFQQLLEATGESGDGVWQERDLFFAPATAARDRTPARAGAEGAEEAVPPLLAQLQEQLVDPARWPVLSLAPGDASLEFHGCPGPLRQVQIVRDRLLQLLAADPSLEPRDILVMTPDVERFAPLVASVFGDSTATGVELPWRLTDRSQQSEAGIGRTLLALLRLAGDRVTASGLEALLECRPLQQRFGLTPEETAPLVRALQRCGFRWGLDAAERGGTATHSLAWALDRLLLGLVLPTTPGLAPGDAAPFEAAAPLERIGRWLHLLGRLRHWLGELRRGATVPQWGERLRELLADLFGDGGTSAWEVPVVLAALEDWREAAAGGRRPPVGPGALERKPSVELEPDPDTATAVEPDAGPALEMEAPVVAEVLDALLAADSGRFGHRSGALTISALEPMRAIPHRVIVLMGLDADVFPRQSPRPGFHLMERQRCLGDPHPADQDRYVLLEALLSARDHLLLTWSCREERKGEELPPATPVQQWLDWLRSGLREVAAGLEVRHAADPLDRTNFQAAGARPPASCDRRLLQTRRLLDRDPPRPRGALLGRPMPANPPPGLALDPFEDLRAWLMEPQRHWLAELGLRPGEWQEQVDDLEALDLEERDRAALLRQALAAAAEAASLEGAPAGTGDWLAQSRGQGRFPPHSGGLLEARALHRRWESLAASLEPLGPARREPLAWGPWQATPLRHGDAVVLVHTATERVAHRLDLWLQVLLAGAACPESDRPARGLLISRSQDRFAVTCRLVVPAPEQALAELERLAALRRCWSAACWPVPPETGWAYRAAEIANPGTGFGKAADCWEGGFNQRAEREGEVMAVCFGATLPAAALIDAAFRERAAELFDPLLAALQAPPRAARGPASPGTPPGRAPSRTARGKGR